jgi:CubicO group peptidase (beta-lactamase class C family)
MSNKSIWILVIFILSFPSYALERSVKKELDNELAAVANEFEIPALALAVIASGKLVYKEGFGFQGKENTLPVTNNTLFRIASISKLFTAQAIMQLVEKNKLNLDDRVSEYLPEMMGSNITIRQLLTHSSGLRDQLRPVPRESKRSAQDYLKLVGS